VERPGVEQGLDALASQHFPRSCWRWRDARNRRERLFLASGQVGEPLAHRVFGHGATVVATASRPKPLAR
jgi:hypothetical protein